MESDQSSTVKLKDAIDATEEILSSQIRALEILTNLLCSGDDSDDEELYEDESDSEESDETGGMALEALQTEILPELKAKILEAKLFQVVLEKANFPAENVCQALSQHRAGAFSFLLLSNTKKLILYFLNLGKLLLNRYETLQCRAFLCLNNLAMCLNVEEMAGHKGLFDIWCNLGRVAFEGSEKSDQVLEAATTSMRAIIQKLLLQHGDIIDLLKVEDVAVLCGKVKNCSEPRSKVNLLQILGTIGSMAAGNEAPLSDARAGIVRIIGQILIELIGHEKDLWILAECFDAMIDVFKEDHTDSIAVEIQLVHHLKSVALGFKQQVHAQRRSLGEHLPVVLTAKENLLRFIKYKAKQRR